MFKTLTRLSLILITLNSTSALAVILNDVYIPDPYFAFAPEASASLMPLILILGFIGVGLISRFRNKK